MARYDLEDNNLKVYLSGHFDTKLALNLRKRIMTYLNKGVKNISVYMEELDDIDSTGLGVLVTANKLVHKNNGELLIKSINSHIRKIFELTRLNKVFQI